MRTGDIVTHRPSGERWVVAAASESSVYPAGWPATRAALTDCEVVRPASDEEHRKMVASILIAFDRKRDDARHYHNRRIGLELGLARTVEEVCSACGGRGVTHDFELIADAAAAAPAIDMEKPERTIPGSPDQPLNGSTDQRING